MSRANMARTYKTNVIAVASNIIEALKAKKAQEGRHQSLSAYASEILEFYVKGLLMRDPGKANSSGIVYHTQVGDPPKRDRRGQAAS